MEQATTNPVKHLNAFLQGLDRLTVIRADVDKIYGWPRTTVVDLGVPEARTLAREDV
jgi:hypothetical protein